MRYPHIAITILILLLLNISCTVGPNYVKPGVAIPAKFKETHGYWTVAQPQDDRDRGAWWRIFHDSQLDTLERQVASANQTVAVAEAQYRQALALVDEARASYFPTIAANLNVTRQLQGSNGFITPGTSSLSVASAGTVNSHALGFNASWEPDIWGGVRRSVEADNAGAQAAAAALVVARWLAEASLAQDYFELRAVDMDQRLLDNTLIAYKKTLQLTLNRYQSGVAGRADVVQAQSQLATAQAQAVNNQINRAKYEHALAVLMGRPPATFTLAAQPLTAQPPKIPLILPATLLERRPDIAQAERQMAQANAAIGVATAAYFPTLPLMASAISQKRGLADWFTLPPWSWAVSAQVAATLFDGGLRSATVTAARANFDASVANYRQTVLTAYQDVEDNLATLAILNQEAPLQNLAATKARDALHIVINEYKAGTAAYTDVLVAQIAAFTAARNAVDINGLQMSAAVGVMKSLGGGYEMTVN